MCSIGEDDFGDEGGRHAMEAEPIADTDSALPDELCKKCNTERVVVKLNCKEAQCKQCFLNYVRHKFRATLGSSKLIPKGSNVLLAVDGSPQSIVLLDMTHHALNEELFRRIHFHPQVVIIDDSSFRGESMVTDAEKKQHLDNVKCTMKKFNIPVHYSSLDINESLSPLQTAQVSETVNSSAFKTFGTLKSVTSKQDFLAKAKTNRLFEIATQLECQFIFKPEISVDMAVILLSSISLGKGASAAMEVSLCDNRFPGVKVIRPLKDLTDNEVCQYIRLQELSTFAHPPVNAKPYASIQNLTQNFVANLQANFPATVSTVYRTGDKIAPSKRTIVAHERGTCDFCRCPLDHASELNINNLRIEESPPGSASLHCRSCQNIFKEMTNKT